MPGFFYVETVLPATGVDSPIPAIANVAAYWTAIQKNEHAARVLIELRRGVEERREMIRSGALDVVTATVPGVECNGQDPRSLLNSQATTEQPGVSTRTVCIADTPVLAQPCIARLNAEFVRVFTELMPRYSERSLSTSTRK